MGAGFKPALHDDFTAVQQIEIPHQCFISYQVELVYLVMG